jgi:hypothetical protein
VIYGSDLQNADTDLDPAFRDSLDPEGFSLVRRTVPTDEKYKLLCLFKMRDTDEPVEGSVTLTGRDFGKIVKWMEIE